MQRCTDNDTNHGATSLSWFVSSVTQFIINVAQSNLSAQTLYTSCYTQRNHSLQWWLPLLSITDWHCSCKWMEHGTVMCMQQVWAITFLSQYSALCRTCIFVTNCMCAFAISPWHSLDNLNCGMRTPSWQHAGSQHIKTQVFWPHQHVTSPPTLLTRFGSLWPLPFS